MMRSVAVTGATGFIGRALVRELAARGFAAVALTRDPAGAGFDSSVEVRRFDPAGAAPNPSAFVGVDAVIHLAGESVGGRWTPEKKKRIYESRVFGTCAVVASLARCTLKPEVLVSASAVGFYGSRHDESLTESSQRGNDFLSSVVGDWERESEKVRETGMREVRLRTGIVLGKGGALAKMSAPFALGLGGPFGSGRQFVPWIHIDDIVSLYIYAVEHDCVRGPVNAVAPDYATSARFALALGNALSRPAYVPAPGFALRMALGEFADTILASQLVIPTVAEDSGFRWEQPHLESAMVDALSSGRPRKSNVHRFESEQLVAGSLENVFAYFSEATNLEKITPQRFHFQVRSLPQSMERGAQIAYRLSLHGVPLQWKTLIAEWSPPRRFVDVQLHGPYALWRHQHDFEPAEDGVLIRDAVDYVLPLAPFANFAQPLVTADLRAIFAFRAETMRRHFGAPGPQAARLKET